MEKKEKRPGTLLTNGDGVSSRGIKIFAKMPARCDDEVFNLENILCDTIS